MAGTSKPEYDYDLFVVGAGSGGVRAGAGALQAAAIITFAFTMIRHLRR